MLKTKLAELWRTFVRRLNIFLRPWPRLRHFINSWPRLILAITAAVIFLYYPLGALLTNDIDTSTDYEISKKGTESATVSTMSSLIRREVYNKSWTPALPFIFPAYALDNMPAFQLGLMSAVSNTSKLLAARMNIDADIEDKSPLHTAAELLQYPGTIWMFSPDNKLVPAPSSNSQYRRARKQLDNYNMLLAEGRAVFSTSPQNLIYILNGIKKDLYKGSAALENHIRENSQSFYDGRSDDVFYLQQGKIYSYYLLLKALGVDFKETIVQSGIYQLWTSTLKSLEDASHLSPFIVRNGEPDSTFAPNHLAAIGFYERKAVIIIQKMLTILEEPK